ncbi:hypothetical protein HYX16_05180 [Candidatus Woesearchaeota archaeon]|nr:hypothetical protein [Candidatus Woesearchaeota archaeon]
MKITKEGFTGLIGLVLSAGLTASSILNLLYSERKFDELLELSKKKDISNEKLEEFYSEWKATDERTNLHIELTPYVLILGLWSACLLGIEKICIKEENKYIEL